MNTNTSAQGRQSSNARNDGNNVNDRKSADAWLSDVIKRLEASSEAPSAEEIAAAPELYREAAEALIEARAVQGDIGVIKVKKLLFKKFKGLYQFYCADESESEQEEEQEKRRIRFVSDAQFENVPVREWNVYGIIPTQSTVILYGPPACLKTFISMSWAFSIGTGKDWLGRKVTKCPVAYIVAEGGYGVGSRVKALKKHHGYTGESGIKWYPDTLAIQNEAVMSELIEALREDFSETPGILFIDTLHKCSVGADENSNNDMGRVLNAADTISKQLKCTVVIIHHTGKNGELRGASCLTGDTEVQIKVMPTDSGCVVTCDRIKEVAPFLPIYLEKKVVEFGDNEGENSLVLMASDKPSKLALSKSEQAMYAAILGKELTHSQWVDLGIAAKLSESSAKNAIRSLVSSGRVAHVERIYRAIPTESS